MKKLNIILLSILLIPLTVKAASPSVKTLETTVEGNTIKYTGTMEDGSYAVMCKLYQDDKEIDLLSSATDNNNFEGSFVAPTAGEYKVYCANYEGGEVKKVDVVVETQPETTSNNPKTYDAGIGSSVAILGISVAGIVGSTVYLKKRKK